MDCSRFLAGYSDYDDSLLPPAEEAAFRAHMEVCPACDRYDRVLRKGRMVARQVAPEPSRDFLPQLQYRLLADPSPALAPAGPVLAGGFLTLLLAAVTGLWLFEVEGGKGLGAVAMGAAGGDDVAFEQVAARPLSLPMLVGVAPADWTTGRVDRADASSYSPLVIGPPAYRADRSVTTAQTSTTRRSLD